MSLELDNVSQSLINNQIPDMWKSKSYPSLKPLSSWFEDLIKRVEFFKNWLLADFSLKTYWISAFFFP
jgi:dynein heavy chain